MRIKRSNKVKHRTDELANQASIALKLVADDQVFRDKFVCYSNQR